MAMNDADLKALPILRRYAAINDGRLEVIREEDIVQHLTEMTRLNSARDCRRHSHIAGEAVEILKAIGFSSPLVTAVILEACFHMDVMMCRAFGAAFGLDWLSTSELVRPYSSDLDKGQGYPDPIGLDELIGILRQERGE